MMLLIGGFDMRVILPLLSLILLAGCTTRYQTHYVHAPEHWLVPVEWPAAPGSVGEAIEVTIPALIQSLTQCEADKRAVRGLGNPTDRP
jgi:hypothetical protein